MSSPNSGNFRRYTWTIYDPNIFSDPESLVEKLTGDPKVAYAVFQQERCPRTGNHHLQGYLRFKNPNGWRQVQRSLGDQTAHVEVALGSEKQNEDYCSKDDRIAGPWIVGNPAAPGKRNDLAHLIEMVQDGRNDFEIASEEPVPYARYARHIRDYRTAMQNPTIQDVEVIVIQGPTDIGKTHQANAIDPDLYNVVIPPPGGKLWWDGYRGQKTVLFDEFTGADQISITDMLKYLDKWKKMREIKGGFVALTYSRVIICTNHDWISWYPNCSQNQQDALRRRLKHVIVGNSRQQLEVEVRALGLIN